MKMDLKKIFVIGTAGFLVVCMGLFYVLTNSTKANSRSQRELNLESMERKLGVLEEEFKSHRISMKELETLALSGDKPETNNLNNNVADIPGHNIGVGDEKQEASSGTCSASVGIEKQAVADINMLDMYELLKFDNPDGGSWKQGFDIQIDSSRFTKSNKLTVFVIPHSHNDPGWIKTFEKYYEDQTKHILDNMLLALSSNSGLKFIWAEISYFNLWWKGLSLGDKQNVQLIVDNKQLEFVTGGWVMPDEANSHFYSILLQLTEGHQWLYHHLQYVPKNGWAIDPFGMSPTMAYILSRAGLNNMLIQRTHYAVKKHLAKLQNLEFKWRQIWDSDPIGSTDILCHMMPFYSYDVPHTCGPEPKVCCQFDFKRMRGVSSMSCPWNVPPQPIVNHNVKERSLTLLDQYKKKSMLYKTNVLLVPLGDDFRWEDKPEWDAQVNNYGKIFDYINSQPDLNAEVKFGTLDDYFQALGTKVKDGEFTPGILSGDFFTYADRDDHYWSGYYTSRPFHKAMDRELLSHVRAAQIAFTLMTAELSKKINITENSFIRSLLGKLIQARRNLSLFQHHDGVTGTSKDHVMVDYAQKMHTGLLACNHVMQQSLHLLTHLKDPSIDLDEVQEDSVFYDAVLAKDHHHSLPRHNVITIDRDITDRLVTVLNPAASVRTQLVTIYVSTYYIKVVDIEGDPVEFEILPVFEDRTSLSKNIFQLNFVTELQPLAVKNFIIKHDGSVKNLPQPEILVINSPSRIFDSEKFKIQSLTEGTPISISNGYLTLDFKDNGFANSVVVNGMKYPFSIGMFKYGVNNRRETSGLYLFIPDGPAVPLDTTHPFIKVVKGKFMSYVEVWIKQAKHRVTLFNHPGFERYSVDVSNVIDIRDENNFELMMRFGSRIKSEGVSYTDLNGFQMIRRKKFDKLPLQANYYPLPAATYIEDADLRMSILTRQPLGTASLSNGEIEVMMDRRLMQDDNRGAGQGDKDNLETINSFKVMFEVPQCQDSDSSKKAPMLSLASQIALHDLLHPFRSFASPMDLTATSLSGVTDYSNTIPNGESSTLACDVELVDMAMLPNYRVPLDDHSYIPNAEAAITIRRLGFDGRYLDGIPMPKCDVSENRMGRFSLYELIGDLFLPKIAQMNLSFLSEGKKLTTDESIQMRPMEIYGFKTYFQVTSSSSISRNSINLVDNRVDNQNPNQK